MQNDEKVIILPLDIRPSFEEFLDFLCITKKGLAAQLFEPVYAQIFTYSRNIKEEYFRYYSIEYPTLSDFVEICHDTRLSEDELDKKYIFKFKNRCPLTDPDYDTDNMDRIIKLLKEKEDKDEN